MNKKVIIITGSELRHSFFRKYLALSEGIEVVASYCESEKGSLQEFVSKSNYENELRTSHLAQREQVEKDFFGLFCSCAEDKSNPVFIEKGTINDQKYQDAFKQLDPDLIISYGCSIIKEPLIGLLTNRFINIHLGLSPYYRGSGTNYWPFVNDELQFVGVTFMHIDSGVDTGEIIHQYRARMLEGDNIHQVGNRLILDTAEICRKVILKFDDIQSLKQVTIDKQEERYYKKRDFSDGKYKKRYGW